VKMHRKESVFLSPTFLLRGPGYVPPPPAKFLRLSSFPPLHCHVLGFFRTDESARFSFLFCRNLFFLVLSGVMNVAFTLNGSLLCSRTSSAFLPFDLTCILPSLTLGALITPFSSILFGLTTYFCPYCLPGPREQPFPGMSCSCASWLKTRLHRNTIPPPSSSRIFTPRRLSPSQTQPSLLLSPPPPPPTSSYVHSLGTQGPRSPAGPFP